MTDPLDVWRRVLDTARLPRWLEEFGEGDGARVVGDVFRGRELLGERSPADAIDRLLEWLLVLGEHGSFASRLDEAVAAHIDGVWAGTVRTNEDAVSLARALDLAAAAPTFEAVGDVLRRRARDRESLQTFAGGMDLEGAYLTALARHQPDRELWALWWDISRLPAGTPWWHGRAAVRGMDGMPAIPEEDGSFRAEVAHTVVRVVEAWTRKVVEGELDAAEAGREQRALARLAFDAYPDSEGWAGIIQDRQIVNPAAEPTLAGVFHWLDAPEEPQTAAQDDVRDPPNWASLAQPIARRLEAGDESAVGDADQLLERLRGYTARSGEPYFLTMTLSNLARHIVDHDAGRADRWAREAIRWHPSSVAGWMPLIGTLVRTDPGRAVTIGWNAAARFPEDPYVWAELSYSLRQAKLFQTSAVVNEYGAARVAEEDPDGTVEARFRIGLAGVYRVAGRPEEALSSYVEASTAMVLREKDWSSILTLVKQVSKPVADAALTALVRNAGGQIPGDVTLPEFEESTAELPPGRVPLAELTDDAAVRDAILSSDGTGAVLEARIRRRQAALGGDDSGLLLASARELLSETRERWPDSRIVETELALLAFDESGREDVAEDGRFVSTYLNARVSRDRGRGKRVRGGSEIEELRAPWQRLRSLDAAARPGALLGEGRACAAALDGQDLVAEARWAFGQLAVWGAPHKRGTNRHTFESDWILRLETVMDPAAAQTMNPDILRLTEASRSQVLDELEEDMLVPLRRGTGFDPAVAG